MTALELIIDLHKNSDRQEPESENDTLRALDLLNLPTDQHLKVADIGCGSGGQTISLAKNIHGQIIAVDLFPEFLNELNEKTQKSGLTDKVITLERSMKDLSFKNNEFDPIWSKGAIYNIGFENGIKKWKNYLKSYVAFLILALFSFGCGKKGENPVTPSTNITYSNSPFDLQGINAKFAKDIAYDSKARTQFDIWLPNSNNPTGLVIYVHGGGFTSGDKDFVYAIQSGGAWDFPTDIRFLLQNNIAFATIRYSYLNNTGETEGVKKPMSDVRRALQYIRSRPEILILTRIK